MSFKIPVYQLLIRNLIEVFTAVLYYFFKLKRLMILHFTIRHTIFIVHPQKDMEHGLQSRPPSPKRAERKVRRRPFREAGSGQNNGTR